MSTKDYYQILGVPSSASTEDIKRAYRLLAKQYHPDSAGQKNAGKFQEITEAYQLLSDQQKRQVYDQQRAHHSQQFTSKNWQKKQFRDQWHDFHWEKMVNDCWRPHSTSTSHIEIPIEKAYAGGYVDIEGLDLMPIRVTIRPRTSSGTSIKVASRAGDIDIIIKVVGNTQFRLVGEHIETIATIDLKTAVLGGELIIKNPIGEKYCIRIPPGTQSGTVFNLARQGLGNNDIRVKVDVDIPKCTNQQELLAFQEVVRAYTL